MHLVIAGFVVFRDTAGSVDSAGTQGSVPLVQGQVDIQDFAACRATADSADFPGIVDSADSADTQDFRHLVLELRGSQGTPDSVVRLGTVVSAGYQVTLV